MTLIFSSSITSESLGAPKSPNFGGPGADCWTTALGGPGQYLTTCCWDETDPSDPEQIEMEYCQHCDYDPSTGTHSGCGEAHQTRTLNPQNGRLPPGGLEDLPTLEQVPNTSPPQFGDRNDADVPLTGNIEQPKQTEQSTNDQSNDGGQLPTMKNTENIPLDNEITEQSDVNDGGQGTTVPLT